MVLAGAADALADQAIENAADVFIYALPLYEMSRVRRRALAGRAKSNTLYHARALADARSRAVTTPNTDTLYSTAWIDLSAGPVEITLGAAAGRYQSVALMDLYSNNFAVLHPSGEPRSVTLRHGEGAECLASPTREVWLLARTYAAGAADLDPAHGAQHTIRLTAPSIETPTAPLLEPAVKADPATVFAAMATLVRDNPLPAEDQPIRDAIARLGPMPSPAVLQAGRAAAMTRLRALRATERNGWRYPHKDLADFGRDYVYRAQVAIGGLAALPVSEAIYLSWMGQPVTGNRGYRLRVPGQGLFEPGGFWSLTLYEPDGAGGLYFYDNPERGYAIKSGSRDLARGSDGSVEIVMSHVRPDGHGANWLPAPEGAFSAVFRTYLPTEAFRSGALTLPEIVAVQPFAR